MTPTSEYELFLNHVYKLSERRQTVTTVYLSVNAALTSAIAFLFKDGRLDGSIPEMSALALLFSGIVACSLWRILITHYGKLIGWWYEQLRVLENSLQNSNRLITKEFHELYLIKQGKGPIGITRYETSLTWLFTVIYVVFGLAILITILLSLL